MQHASRFRSLLVVVALLGAVVFLCDFSLSNFVQFATHLVR